MSVDPYLAVVDPERLRAHLQAIEPFAGPVELSLVGGGASNLTFLARAGRREYVVRRRPLGRVAKGAHDMHREHRVQHALGTTTLPVARVHGYSDDESVVGAPFYVMDRVHGAVLHRHADVAGLDPARATELSLDVVDALVRLHAVDVGAVGLAELGRPQAFVSRRIGRWLDQWRAGDHRDLPAVEALGARLAAAVPARTDETLVHGDYRLGNLVVDLAPPAHVVAMLDWEMSTLGDPLTDLAHLLVYWEPSCGRVTHEAQRIAEAPGFPTGAELADRYAASSGRAVDHLDVYLAFEHWRAAIIKDAIHLRRTAGAVPDAADDDAVDMGESVALHLAEAADLLGRVPGA